MAIKPGYKTSEFWFTFVSFIFSGLYLIGLIGDNTQKEDLIQETSRGLEALILIIGQLTVLYKYVKGRSDLKKIWWTTIGPTETKTVDTPKRKTKKKTSKALKSKTK